MSRALGVLARAANDERDVARARRGGDGAPDGFGCAPADAAAAQDDRMAVDRRDAGVRAFVLSRAGTATEGDVACTFTYVETPPLARTACTSSGRELWHADEAHAFVEDAALVLDRGTLYSARISNISSGCTLHAFDARTGAARWTKRLEGLGPIDHSEYLNAVELRIVGGRPVVFGWESAGRYIEALDPTTGAAAFHAIVSG